MRARRADLLGIGIAALGLRFCLVLSTMGSYTPFEDAGDFDRHAWSIASGHGFPLTIFAAPGTPSALRPPGFPYLLAGVYALFGHSLAAGRLSTVVLGAAVAPLVYLIAACIWRRRLIALIAGALAACFAPLVMVSGSLLSEALFIPVELGAVWAVLLWRERPRWRTVVAAGVCCGVALLTRTLGVGVLLPVLIGVASSTSPRRQRLVAGALVVITAAAVVAPWTIRNAVALKAFVPVSTQDGFTAAGTYNAASEHDPVIPAHWSLPDTVPAFAGLFHDPRVNEATLDQRLGSRAIAYAEANPGYVARVVALNSLRMFNLTRYRALTAISYTEMGVPRGAFGLTTWSAWVVSALALLGLVLAAVARRRRRWAVGIGPLFVWLVPVAMLLGAAIVLGPARYRAPIDPFLVLLAALLIGRGIEALGRSRGRRGGVGRPTG